MKRTLRRKLGLCFLVLVVVGLGIAVGGDVAVREGNLDVAGDLTVCSDIFVLENLYVNNGFISGNPDAYLDDVYAFYVHVDTDLDVDDDLDVGNDLTVGGTVYCGKINGGFLDPEWVQYDRQSRSQVVESVKRVVPPEKQGGAVLFFNKDTKRLENYIPNEGTFYDLQGNVVHILPQIELATTSYEPAYYLDHATGDLKPWQKPVSDEYVLRRGYRVGAKAGEFISEATGRVVPREKALELYVASEGNYYDLQGKLLRSEPSEDEIEYVTEYYFDSRTGEVEARRRAIRDKYVIKKGFSFDKKTGRFIDERTGLAVAKDVAIGVKKGTAN